VRRQRSVRVGKDGGITFSFRGGGGLSSACLAYYYYLQLMGDIREGSCVKTKRRGVGHGNYRICLGGKLVREGSLVTYGSGRRGIRKNTAKGVKKKDRRNPFEGNN